MEPEGSSPPYPPPVPVLTQINPVYASPHHPTPLTSIVILSSHLRLGLPECKLSKTKKKTLRAYCNASCKHKIKLSFTGQLKKNSQQMCLGELQSF